MNAPILMGILLIAIGLVSITAGYMNQEKPPKSSLTINQFDWMNTHVPDWRERLARGESVSIHVPPEPGPDLSGLTVFTNGSK